MTPQPPTPIRAYVFVDGMNLFNAAKRAFGYDYPNYDILKLSQLVCNRRGWQLGQIRFYTGIPSLTEDPARHAFWGSKLRPMGRQGILCTSRQLQYHDVEVDLPGGGTKIVRQAREKGIDIRLALDVVLRGLEHAYDVALILSQDQDLSEVAREMRRIAALKGWWLRVASAHPIDGHHSMHDTDAIPLDKASYDLCLDPTDYRPIMAKTEAAAAKGDQLGKTAFNTPRFKN
jgi:uncharacterized LabA/DUF88 family protein